MGDQDTIGPDDAKGKQVVDDADVEAHRLGRWSVVDDGAGPDDAKGKQVVDDDDVEGHRASVKS